MTLGVAALLAVGVIVGILTAVLGRHQWRDYLTAAVLCRVPLLVGLALVALAFPPDPFRNLLALRTFGECMMVGMLLLQAGALVGLLLLLILRYAPERFGFEAELPFRPFDLDRDERLIDRWPILRLVPFCALGLPVAIQVARTTADHEEMGGTILQPSLGLATGALAGLSILLAIEWLWRLEHYPKPFIRFATWVFERLRPPGFLDGNGRILPGHGLAFAMMTVLFLLYWLLGRLLAPHVTDLQMPALAALIGLLMLIVSLLGALTFTLDRWRVPVLLAVLAFEMLINALWPFDHHFPAHRRSVESTTWGASILEAAQRRSERAAARLVPFDNLSASAVEVDPANSDAGSSPAAGRDAADSDVANSGTTSESARDAATPLPRIITVVTTSGGGIQASAWTTRVLAGLDTCVGRRFTDSIHLVTGASGGAVGAMYFLEALRRESQTGSNDASGRELAATLERAHLAAAHSSLGAAAWGMAYPDFRRLIFPVAIGNRMRDRAWATERAWLRHLLLLEDAEIARRRRIPLDHHDQPWLSDWAEAAQRGELPGVVFNGTFVEDGEPFFMSSLDLSTLNFADHRSFDPTGVEHYGATLDIPIVTAARLASTFPFVTPVAHPELVERDPDASQSGGEPDFEEPDPWHVADGGYYDNFGTLPAALWLEHLHPDLAAQDRVLLLRIDSFPTPTKTAPEHGPSVLSPLLAPLQALLAVRDSSQVLRSDIELDLLRRHFTDANDLSDASGTSLQILRIRPERADDEPPLSWHLSARELSALADSWNAAAPAHCEAVQRVFEP